MNRAVNEILAQREVEKSFQTSLLNSLPVSSGRKSARYVDLLQEEFCSRLLFGGCLGFGTLAD